MTDALLELADLTKTFTMHEQGGVRLPVVQGVGFAVYPGECVVLDGPSGTGKSSILKMIYGNYLAGSGAIRVRHQNRVVDLAQAAPRVVLDVRRHTIGYVSQFLRALPRVAARDVVAEPLISRGLAAQKARERARDLLMRLNLPERLHNLPPATFSGGEQQRVNIARGFITPLPLLLLDEPTASLDARNAEVVLGMIAERKAQGTGMLAIMHEPATRARIADRLLDVGAFRATEGAA